MFGIRQPILLWPASIADRLADDHIEAILAHELCHVARRDNLWAAVHMVVQTLFWFHPLVWWIGARLVDERERACDESVVAAGSEPERVRGEHPQDLPALARGAGALHGRRHRRESREADGAHHERRADSA